MAEPTAPVTAARPDRAPEPPTATELAGYRIERLLGMGGLGAVYAAIDPHGLRVALKTFNAAEGLDGAAQQTFEREAMLYRQLEHPHIVKLLGAGITAGSAWISMELVAGHDLAAHTQPPRLLPQAAVLSIASRVAAALGHAHRRGIVHRDVKPQNILLDWPGDTVKLADFGIATLGDAFRTQTGVVLGTPAYMSPEQLCGGVIDARSDLYALGVVLFEALAGRRPHEGPSLGALLRQVASADAPPLHALLPTVPGAVSDLVGRLLSRAADQRPADAANVATVLERLAQDLRATELGPISRG